MIFIELDGPVTREEVLEMWRRLFKHKHKIKIEVQVPDHIVQWAKEQA